MPPPLQQLPPQPGMYPVQTPPQYMPHSQPYITHQAPAYSTIIQSPTGQAMPAMGYYQGSSLSYPVSPQYPRYSHMPPPLHHSSSAAVNNPPPLMQTAYKTPYYPMRSAGPVSPQSWNYVQTSTSQWNGNTISQYQRLSSPISPVNSLVYPVQSPTSSLTTTSSTTWNSRASAGTVNHPPTVVRMPSPVSHPIRPTLTVQQPVFTTTCQDVLGIASTVSFTSPGNICRNPSQWSSGFHAAENRIEEKGNNPDIQMLINKVTGKKSIDKNDEKSTENTDVFDQLVQTLQQTRKKSLSPKFVEVDTHDEKAQKIQDASSKINNMNSSEIWKSRKSSDDLFEKIASAKMANPPCLNGTFEDDYIDYHWDSVDESSEESEYNSLNSMCGPTSDSVSEGENKEYPDNQDSSSDHSDSSADSKSKKTGISVHSGLKEEPTTLDDIHVTENTCSNNNCRKKEISQEGNDVIDTKGKSDQMEEAEEISLVIPENSLISALRPHKLVHVKDTLNRPLKTCKLGFSYQEESLNKIVDDLVEDTLVKIFDELNAKILEKTSSASSDGDKFSSNDVCVDGVSNMNSNSDEVLVSELQDEEITAKSEDDNFIERRSSLTLEPEMRVDSPTPISVTDSVSKPCVEIDNSTSVFPSLYDNVVRTTVDDICAVKKMDESLEETFVTRCRSKSFDGNIYSHFYHDDIAAPRNMDVKSTILNVNSPVFQPKSISLVKSFDGLSPRRSRCYSHGDVLASPNSLELKRYPQSCTADFGDHGTTQEAMKTPQKEQERSQLNVDCAEFKPQQTLSENNTSLSNVSTFDKDVSFPESSDFKPRDISVEKHTSKSLLKADCAEFKPNGICHENQSISLPDAGVKIKSNGVFQENQSISLSQLNVGSESIEPGISSEENKQVSDSELNVHSAVFEPKEMLQNDILISESVMKNSENDTKEQSRQLPHLNSKTSKSELNFNNEDSEASDEHEVISSKPVLNVESQAFEPRKQQNGKEVWSIGCTDLEPSGVSLLEQCSSKVTLNVSSPVFEPRKFSSENNHGLNPQLNSNSINAEADVITNENQSNYNQKLNINSAVFEPAKCSSEGLEIQRDVIESKNINDSKPVLNVNSAIFETKQTSQEHLRSQNNPNLDSTDSEQESDSVYDKTSTLTEISDDSEESLQTSKHLLNINSAVFEPTTLCNVNKKNTLLNDNKAVFESNVPTVAPCDKMSKDSVNSNSGKMIITCPITGKEVFTGDSPTTKFDKVSTPVTQAVTPSGSETRKIVIECPKTRKTVMTVESQRKSSSPSLESIDTSWLHQDNTFIDQGNKPFLADHVHQSIQTNCYAVPSQMTQHSSALMETENLYQRRSDIPKNPSPPSHIKHPGSVYSYLTAERLQYIPRFHSQKNMTYKEKSNCDKSTQIVQRLKNVLVNTDIIQQKEQQTQMDPFLSPMKDVAINTVDSSWRTGRGSKKTAAMPSGLLKHQGTMTSKCSRKVKCQTDIKGVRTISNLFSQKCLGTDSVSELCCKSTQADITTVEDQTSMEKLLQRALNAEAQLLHLNFVICTKEIKKQVVEIEQSVKSLEFQFAPTQLNFRGIETVAHHKISKLHHQLNNLQVQYDECLKRLYKGEPYASLPPFEISFPVAGFENSFTPQGFTVPDNIISAITQDTIRKKDFITSEVQTEESMKNQIVPPKLSCISSQTDLYSTVVASSQTDVPFNVTPQVHNVSSQTHMSSSITTQGCDISSQTEMIATCFSSSQTDVPSSVAPENNNVSSQMDVPSSVSAQVCDNMSLTKVFAVDPELSYQTSATTNEAVSEHAFQISSTSSPDHKTKDDNLVSDTKVLLNNVSDMTVVPNDVDGDHKNCDTIESNFIAADVTTQIVEEGKLGEFTTNSEVKDGKPTLLDEEQQNSPSVKSIETYTEQEDLSNSEDESHEAPVTRRHRIVLIEDSDDELDRLIYGDMDNIEDDTDSDNSIEYTNTDINHNTAELGNLEDLTVKSEQTSVDNAVQDIMIKSDAKSIKKKRNIAFENLVSAETEISQEKDAVNQNSMSDTDKKDSEMETEKTVHAEMKTEELVSTEVKPAKTDSSEQETEMSLSTEKKAVETVSSKIETANSVSPEKRAAKTVASEKVIRKSMSPEIKAGKTVSSELETEEILSPGIKSRKTVATELETEQILSPGIKSGTTVATELETEQILSPGIKSGKTVSSELEIEKTLSNDTETEKLVSTKTKAEDIVFSESESEKSMSTEIEMVKILSTEIKAEKTVSNELKTEKSVLAETEIKKTISNELETEKKVSTKAPPGLSSNLAHQECLSTPSQNTLKKNEKKLHSPSQFTSEKKSSVDLSNEKSSVAEIEPHSFVNDKEIESEKSSLNTIPNPSLSNESSHHNTGMPPGGVQPPSELENSLRSMGIEPSLFQSVVWELLKNDPNLASNPQLLQSYALQQCMALQYYMSTASQPIGSLFPDAASTVSQPTVGSMFGVNEPLTAGNNCFVNNTTTVTSLPGYISSAPGAELIYPGNDVDTSTATSAHFAPSSVMESDCNNSNTVPSSISRTVNSSSNIYAAVTQSVCLSQSASVLDTSVTSVNVSSSLKETNRKLSSSHNNHSSSVTSTLNVSLKPHSVSQSSHGKSSSVGNKSAISTAKSGQSSQHLKSSFDSKCLEKKSADPFLISNEDFDSIVNDKPVATTAATKLANYSTVITAAKKDNSDQQTSKKSSKSSKSGVKKSSPSATSVTNSILTVTSSCSKVSAADKNKPVVPRIPAAASKLQSKMTSLTPSYKAPQTTSFPSKSSSEDWEEEAHGEAFHFRGSKPRPLMGLDMTSFQPSQNLMSKKGKSALKPMNQLPNQNTSHTEVSGKPPTAAKRPLFEGNGGLAPIKLDNVGESKRKSGDSQKQEIPNDIAGEEENWQQVTKKKKPTKPEVIKSTSKQSTKAKKVENIGKKERETRKNNFERLINRILLTFPFLCREDAFSVIGHIRGMRGGLSGLTLEEILCKANKVVEDKYKSKMMKAKRASSLERKNSLPDVILPPFLRAKTPPATSTPSSINFDGDFYNDEDDSCVICFDSLKIKEIKILDCGHGFHDECIKRWVYGRERTCPTCRSLALFPEEFPKLK